ncbi:MAG TPA: ABC transporter permease [Bacteroidota bacterium]|nr:ABC transporter permease [Bacteroidota bacterium]
MIRLVYYELIKMFLKKRTYIGFGLVLVVVPLIEVAFKLEGGRFLQVATRGLAQDFFMIGNLFNGWLISYQLMNSLYIHIPLLISFVTGDILAGEATAGTYRLLLTRPVSRTKIFFTKYVAAVTYTFLFVAFLSVLSIGLAYALLGGGDLLVVDKIILVVQESEVGWRFIIGYLLALWSMLTIASISFFFSSFVENAIGPIVATMGVLILCLIVSSLPLEVFDSIKPYLFTDYLNLWQKAFHDPIPWNDVQTALMVFGAYSFASAAGAWVIFTRKDILS